MFCVPVYFEAVCGWVWVGVGVCVGGRVMVCVCVVLTVNVGVYSVLCVYWYNVHACSRSMVYPLTALYMYLFPLCTHL